MAQQRYDVVIIGGGPAGLAAATVLGRANRGVALVDAGNQSNAGSSAVHAVFTRDGTAPAEMYDIAREQLRRYACVTQIQGCAAAAYSSDGDYEVTLEDETQLSAPYLLLAQGVKFNYPPIPGIAELWGKLVWHCPYCHGFEANGRRLLAVGDEIWLNGMHRLLPIWTRNITWAPTPEVTQLRQIEDGLAAVICGSEEFFHQCVVQTTVVARDGLADALGCARNEKGQVQIDGNGRTSVKRIFAAGDQTPAGGQVNVAVGAGHAAGVAIIEEMAAAETGQTG